MNSILKRIITRIRVSLFPTEQEKEAKRWFATNGDENLRYDYDLNSDSLVIDLGGYKGQWASDVYARFNCSIFVFEPVKSFADKIEKRFSKNSKIKVFSLALGASKRQETISLCADGSSVYGCTSERESIQFEDAREFFSNHDIKIVDLLKVNIEGGEYELMPRLLETGLINKIKYIQIQFHNIKPDSEALMEAIRNELSKTHSPTYQYKFVWENWVRRAN